MVRTALRPRWLALLVVVLVLASGMAWLGDWQLERARERGQSAAERERDRPPVPVLDVLRARRPFPGDAIGRPVVARGHWDAAGQLLVPGRRLEGRTGFWVLTPLRLEDGSAVAVVRGWVADPSDPAAAAPAPPDGAAPEAVTVTGVLEPGESAADAGPGALPAAGTIEHVDVAELVNRWPYPLLTGYLVASRVEPAPVGPAPRAVPAPVHDGGLNLRNLSYAVQWWIFAAFGLLMWWRLVRDDHLGRLRAAPEAPDGAPDPDAPDPGAPDPDAAGSPAGSRGGPTT